MLAYFLLGRKEDPLWDRIRKYKIVIIAGFLVSAMALTAKLAIDPFFLAEPPERSRLSEGNLPIDPALGHHVLLFKTPAVSFRPEY